MKGSPMPSFLSLRCKVYLINSLINVSAPWPLHLCLCLCLCWCGCAWVCVCGAELLLCFGTFGRAAPEHNGLCSTPRQGAGGSLGGGAAYVPLHNTRKR